MELIVHIKTIFQTNIDEFKLSLFDKYTPVELYNHIQYIVPLLGYKLCFEFFRLQWSNSLADLLGGEQYQVSCVSSNMISDTDIHTKSQGNFIRASGDIF